MCLPRLRLLLARHLGLFRWREVRRVGEWIVQEDVVTGRHRSVRDDGLLAGYLDAAPGRDGR